MAAVTSWLYEKRPLKKTRLGPPDVYPQDPKQKEDELTIVNVKQGFNSNPQIPDEYGSARNSNITPAKFGAYFSALIGKKQEINTFQDSGRKRQQINSKDNFWPVTQRSKNAVEAWFKDLAGSKPLTILSRKVPNFNNKKDEIFTMLHEFCVPMLRATWFIKMESAYTVAMTEVKIKKRTIGANPSQEWTHALCKFLGEQLQKISEYYHISQPSSLSSTASSGSASGGCTTSITSGGGASAANPPPPPPPPPPSSGLNAASTGGTISGSTGSLAAGVTADLAYKQWQYCTQLAWHLYEEGLLDRQEFLSWILDLLEKKSPEDPIMKIIMPLVLQYVDEFVNSELLSRRLAHHAAKKLSQLISDYTSVGSSRSQSPMMNNAGAAATGHAVSPAPTQPTLNPLAACFIELLNCSQLRSIVLSLSAILQVVTLECPTALVWNNVGEGKTNSILHGSPLDFLPCAPSSLPMPPRPNNAQVRAELRQAESLIQQRGRAAEVRWSCDKWQQTAAGTTITRVLNVLDALDRHIFDKVDSNNSLDTLYAKVFPLANSKERGSGPETSDLAEILSHDEPVVRLLCEWAVTTKRSGEHRALVVAKLLEKHQNEIVSEKYGDSEAVDEKDSQDSGGMVPLGLPVYQNLLMNFLDTQAPVIDERSTPEQKASFANHVLLFGELIRYDVFSHDAYMCTLISRGSFSQNAMLPSGGMLLPPTAVPASTSKCVSTPEPSLTGFMANPTPGLSPGPGSAGGLGIAGFGLGMVDGGRSQEPSLPMFEPVDNQPASIKPEALWDLQMDMDDARIDADLDKLLQHIKEGQQYDRDQPDILLPDSVGSDRGEGTPTLSASTPLSHPPLVSSTAATADLSLPAGPNANTTGSSNANTGGDPSSACSQGVSSTMSSTARHLLYTMHFPLPQDESASHDCNQRHILLYGVGKARDEARHAVKKVVKEIMKLFSKKTCMDVADGAKVKKHAKEGFQFEALVHRFQNLSYFDQHVVVQSCASSVIEMLNTFAAGSSNYLPLVEYLSFLFDLMEMALNLHGLIEFCIQLLKELAEVEVQLVQKGSSLAGTYGTSVGLYIVGILYRYQCWLLISHEQTVAAFEGLCKLVKHITNPTECTSAERCILCYLYDLYTSCSHLKSKHTDFFSAMYPKIKQALYTSQNPSALNLLWNTTYMIEYINSPKMKVDPQQIKQLNDNPSYRYSFVCNAIHSISIARDADRLNEVSVLCAELTASCSALSSEWLGVLKALCCSSNHHCGFIDVLTQVDVGDLSIHDNLAVFTSILVARRCFSLQDFVIHVALPSLLSASPAGGGDQDAESGARLTCHLLLRLFKTIETPVPSLSSFGIQPSGVMTHTGTSPVPTVTPNPTQRPVYVIKYPCDRHLLSAAHSSMRVEPVLAVLKAILVLGDVTEESVKAEPKAESTPNKELSINEILGNMDDSDFDLGLPTAILGKSSGSGLGGGVGIESAGLGEFAKHALQQICSQQWVHERCLREPELLSKKDLLLDPLLSHKQAQHLLQLICHPKGGDLPIISDDANDQRQMITHILKNLDQWTLRVSWLELQLMYAQCAQTPSDVNTWLDNVARATIDIFQLTSEESGGYKATNGSLMDNVNNSNNDMMAAKGAAKSDGDRTQQIWLVAPLISKLPSAVQGKILKVAGQVLENGNWTSASSSSSYKAKDKDKQAQKSASLLSHQPFLSLVLMCLKGQDDQRESLLNSLYSQLSQSLHTSKDDKHPVEDAKTKQAMQEALQLRLSLVGGMFDMVQKSTHVINDWAVLLVQLISYSVVDPQINYEVFTTVLDMLAALIHTTQVSDSNGGEKGEKQYHLLVKKLKKELGDMTNEAMHMVHQLLPLPKQQCEVITCEPMGSLIDTKGNKIAGFDSIDKKQGLQVAEKQKVSPWDLLEGHKNPAPLSWSWFGAVRLERKPLRQEDTHRLLLWHTHSIRKPFTYFLEPPPLPPEDLEPPPEKPPQMQMVFPTSMDYAARQPPEELKRGRETPIEQAGRGTKKQKQNRSTRKRQTRATNGQQTPPIRPGMPYPEQPMYPQAPPQAWYNQQAPPQQPPYYTPQQALPPGGPRFDRTVSGHSKAALSSMLRARHPAQFLPGPGPAPQHQQGGVAPGSGGPVSMGGSVPPGHPSGPGPAGGMPGHPTGHPGANPYQNMEMLQKQRQQQLMMRQQMRPQGMAGTQAGMFPHQMQPNNPQGAPLHHMPPQGGMVQGYGTYGNASMQQNAGMMESRNTTMIPTNFNQSYVSPQTGPNMMGPGQAMRAQQNQYMPQPGRPQYSVNQGGMQAPNVTVGQMGGGMGGVSGPNSSHMQVSSGAMVQNSAPPYGASSGKPVAMSAMPGGPQASQIQHMQQLRHQQQMAAMQKQQQQQQHTAAMVAQLQRQLSAGNNQGTHLGPPPPPPQQHHPFPPY